MKYTSPPPDGELYGDDPPDLLRPEPLAQIRIQLDLIRFDIASLSQRARILDNALQKVEQL